MPSASIRLRQLDGRERVAGDARLVLDFEEAQQLRRLAERLLADTVETLEEVIFKKHRGKQRPVGGDIGVCHRLPVDEDRAFLRPVKRGQQPQQRRFSGTVAARDKDRLAGVQRRKDLAAERGALRAAEDVVALHPKAIERYRARVRDLTTAIAGEGEARLAAIGILREFIATPQSVRLPPLDSRPPSRPTVCCRGSWLSPPSGNRP
jgi:hypothetical protein